MTAATMADAYGTAVDALAERLADDPSAARRVLDRISEDGVVTPAAVDDAVADVAGAVATVENRTDRAALVLSEARGGAEPVSDLDAVAGRLDRFDDRLTRLRETVSSLQSDLVSIRDRSEDRGPLALARAIRGLTVRSNRAHRTADELAADVESFEAWLDDPDVRYDELDADLDALDGFVDGAITDARTLDADEGTDPAALWLDAVLRHRVAALLLADLRAELDDLREFPGREPSARADDAADRLDALAARREDLGDRLDAVADPAWHDRHAARLAAAEAAFDAHEPPVEWGALYATLDEHRPDA